MSLIGQRQRKKPKTPPPRPIPNRIEKMLVDCELSRNGFSRQQSFAQSGVIILCDEYINGRFLGDKINIYHKGKECVELKFFNEECESVKICVFDFGVQAGTNEYAFRVRTVFNGRNDLADREREINYADEHYWRRIVNCSASAVNVNARVDLKIGTEKSWMERWHRATLADGQQGTVYDGMFLYKKERVL